MLNAVTSGEADIKRVIADSQNPLLPLWQDGLFVDEIHRFNKAQQDALLPILEDGTLILVGATTENPYFEVNKALISRSTVFALKPLETGADPPIIDQALADQERGWASSRLPGLTRRWISSVMLPMEMPDCAQCPRAGCRHDASSAEGIVQLAKTLCRLCPKAQHRL